MFKSFWIASLVLALTGCMTAYQPDGLTGGYTEVQLSENVWRVSFKGNGYTSRERAVDMALLRSADLTIQQGYNYFAFSDSKSRTDTVGVGTTPTTSYTTGSAYRSGNNIYGSATTTTTGGQTIFISTPTANNTVVMFKNKPENVNGMVYSALFICDSLGKKYDVQCASRTSTSRAPDVQQQANTEVTPPNPKWVLYGVGTTNGAKSYYDPKTIKKTGKQRKVWVLTNAKIKDSQSFTALELIDCAEETHATQYAIFYSGTNGEGGSVFTNDKPTSPKPIVPDSTMQTLMEKVCGRSSK